MIFERGAFELHFQGSHRTIEVFGHFPFMPRFLKAQKRQTFYGLLSKCANLLPSNRIVRRSSEEIRIRDLAN
jgi:hypothetical protein